MCLMIALIFFVLASPLTAQSGPTRWPTRERDIALKDFRFASGERLADVRMHVTTLGTPRRNAAGKIANAVMILHGTGGSGKQFLQPHFADELYGPGQPLDISRYFIILPDNLGHGRSSKPSDALKMQFPKYDYADMVEAQRRMLAEGLGVDHLRLNFGTSMGCMHAFMWGERHPGFADALMPMACQPIEIAGLNRMWRQLAIDGIKRDPAWNRGNYTVQPVQGLRTAQSLLFIAGSSPLYYQALYPSRDKAAAFASERVGNALKSLDANDLIYQVDASRTYNPWPELEKIRAPVIWINSADDFINPRNLDVPAKAVKRMKSATFRLIPETAETRGHSTHTWAKFWKDDLSALLEKTASK